MSYNLDSLKAQVDKNLRQVVLSINSKLAEIVCELNKLKNCCTDSGQSGGNIISGTDIYITGDGSLSNPYVINVINKGYITLEDLTSLFPIKYDNITGTFSIEKSSETSDGYLSKEDWLAFNTKISDKNFVYTQSVPATTWTISHTLDKIPSVKVIDTAGSVIICGETVINENMVELYFGYPTMGQAILN